MDSYIVQEGQEGQRIDHFLLSKDYLVSRSQIGKWIKEGCVKCNDEKVKSSYSIKVGDVITVHPPQIKSTELIAEDIALDIVYEDDDLLVVNKPAHMVVHPAHGHHEGTLTHALLHHCKHLSQIGGVEKPGIVHRLDKGTSGLMVVAKNDATHLGLSQQFHDHLVEKVYRTLVYGVPDPEKGTLESYITRSSSDRKRYAVSDHKGKLAITHYKVLQSQNGLAYLEVKIDTGRTHQIRVHLTHKGHSLVGDPLYGGHSKRAKSVRAKDVKEVLLKLTHPLLHAYSLSFNHPKTQKKLTFKAELPDTFSEVLTIAMGECG